MNHFYIDLLFYHRKLRRLVAIELKLAAFQAADKGQMELYLLFRSRNKTYYSESLIMPSASRRVPPYRITHAEFSYSSP
jgi:YhcG PDDEXK nuclease domain